MLGATLKFFLLYVGPVLPLLLLLAFNWAEESDRPPEAIDMAKRNPIKPAQAVPAAQEAPVQPGLELVSYAVREPPCPVQAAPPPVSYAVLRTPRPVQTSPAPVSYATASTEAPQPKARSAGAIRQARYAANGGDDFRAHRATYMREYRARQSADRRARASAA